MTVIATLRIDGVPVIIGDALVTSNEPGLKSVQVPTVERLPPLKRVISGFCRKAHIVDRRLVVAWTGSRLKAEQIIPNLCSWVESNGCTEDVLKSFLRDFKFLVQGGGRLDLIGWIANPQPRPFSWSSDDPVQVYFDETEVAGSGTEIFDSAFFAHNGHEKGHGLTKEEFVFMRSLCGIARLLSLEVNTGLPLVSGFGFCYDIIAWIGGEFKPIPSYTLLNADARVRSASSRLRFAFVNPIFAYQSFERAAVFSVIRRGEERGADQSFPLERNLTGLNH